MSYSLKARLQRLERQQNVHRIKPKVIIAIFSSDNNFPASGIVGLRAHDIRLQRIPSEPTDEFYRRAVAYFDAEIITAQFD